MIKRLPLQEAFERLSDYRKPQIVVGIIERAWHQNDLQLFCEDKDRPPDAPEPKPLPTAYIKENLALVAVMEAERWRCKVVPTGVRLGFDPDGPYVWTVDEKGFFDLLTSLREGTAGVQSPKRWTVVVDIEMEHLRFKDSPLLANFEPLCEHVWGAVVAITGAPPPDPKRFRRRIRDRLKVQK